MGPGPPSPSFSEERTVEEFTVSRGVRDGFEIVVVRGELDDRTAPDLEATINASPARWP